MKASPARVRLELVVASTGETLEVAEDRRILAKLGLRDKAVLNAKLSQVIGWRTGGSWPAARNNQSTAVGGEQG
jgi:hypothetical protein